MSQPRSDEAAQNDRWTAPLRDESHSLVAAVDALRGVSLEIERPRLTAVIGPSGSGKSTLMHSLAGLDRLRGA